MICNRHIGDRSGRLLDIEKTISNRAEGLTGNRINTNRDLDFLNVDSLNLTVDSLVAYLLVSHRPLTIVAHSQGAAITSVALIRIEEQGDPTQLLTSDLDVYTFGSFTISYPEGPRYRHCVRQGDAIPTFAHALSLVLSPSDYTRYIKSYELSPYGIGYIDEGVNQLYFDGNPLFFSVSYMADFFTHEQHNFSRYMSLIGTGQCQWLPG